MPHSIFFMKDGHAIHGSLDVKNLGKPVSHGCVRISPKNATTLYALVKENGLRFYNEMSRNQDYEYIAAAMAWTGDPKKLNGGGPIWAIFDADAVAREKWQVKPPYVDPYGYFFSADTLE